MPTTICIFLAVSFSKCPNSVMTITKHLRKLSVLIFGLHMIVHFYFTSILGRFFEIKLNSLVNYVIILLITITLAEIIIALSEKKSFLWLKKPY